MRAAGDDHRPSRRAAHLHDVDLEVLADAIRLVWQLLGDREHGFDVLAHVEHDGRIGRALNVAGHDLALAGGVLLEDDVPLSLAEALAVHLAGGLRRDAAELGLRHVLRDPDLAADARRRIDLLRRGRGHLELGILDLLLSRHDLVLTGDADLAGLRIDRDDDVLGRIGVASVGGFDRLLQRMDQDVLGHTFLGIQLEQRSNEVSVHAPLLFRRQTKTWEANRPTSQVLSSVFVVRNGRSNRAEVYAIPLSSATERPWPAPPEPSVAVAAQLAICTSPITPSTYKSRLRIESRPSPAYLPFDRMMIETA